MTSNSLAVIWVENSVKLFKLIHVIYMKIIYMKPHGKVFISCLLTHISAIFGPSKWNNLNEQ